MDLLRRHQNQILAGAITLVIAITLLLSAVITSTKDQYIKNLGTGTDDEGKFINTISVSGDGKVFAKPDMAEVRFNVSETKTTSGEALEAVSKRVEAIQKILKDKGVKEEDIQTSQFDINPDYDWTQSGRKLIGYKADHTISATIKKIDEKGEKVSEIIDAIIDEDNKVEVGTISFDIEDKTDYYKEARELAFERAKKKADELADLSGVDLLKPVSISDVSYDYSTTQSNVSTSTLEAAADAEESKSVSSSISTGQLELSIRINVSFGIE